MEDLTGFFLFFLGVISFPVLISVTGGYLGPEQIVYNPRNHIPRENFTVTEQRFCIEGNYSWSIYADTQSMLPMFGNNSVGITTLVGDDTELKVGDIVSYSLNERFISHRIIHIGEDGDGKYYILKGDNNDSPDTDKVRKEQIERILLGVIW